MTVQQIVNGSITWAENGLPWTRDFPRKPYLVDLYEHDESGLPNYAAAVANGGMDNATRAFPAKLGEVLEIVIQNSGATNGGLDVHPFHAHGAHVYDIGSGNGTYDAEKNEERLRGTHPVKRDTTMLYRYEATTVPGADAGWRAWRLRVTEPGVWMIHCHTLQVYNSMDRRALKM
jgi:FtsP/CotA-like multicopper oxidase with cupredoxin domain